MLTWFACPETPGGQPSAALHECCQIRANADYIVQIALEVCGLALYSVALMLMLVDSGRKLGAKGAKVFGLVHVAFQVTWGMWDLAFFAGFSAGPREVDAGLDARCFAACMQHDATPWQRCEDARWPFPTFGDTPFEKSPGRNQTPASDLCRLPQPPVMEAVALLVARTLVNFYICAVLWSYWQHKRQDRSRNEVISSAVVLPGVDLLSHASSHAMVRRGSAGGATRTASDHGGALIGHLNGAEDGPFARGIVRSVHLPAEVTREAGAEDVVMLELPAPWDERRIGGQWAREEGRPQGGPLDGPDGGRGAEGGQREVCRKDMRLSVETGRHAGSRGHGLNDGEDGRRERVGTAPDEQEILRVLSQSSGRCAPSGMEGGVAGNRGRGGEKAKAEQR